MKMEMILFPTQNTYIIKNILNNSWFKFCSNILSVKNKFEGCSVGKIVKSKIDSNIIWNVAIIYSPHKNIDLFETYY